MCEKVYIILFYYGKVENAKHGKKLPEVKHGQ